jgi:hypothetical protein
MPRGHPRPDRADVSFTIYFNPTTYGLARLAAAREGVSTRRWLGRVVERAVALRGPVVTGFVAPTPKE